MICLSSQVSRGLLEPIPAIFEQLVWYTELVEKQDKQAPSSHQVNKLA